MIDFVEIQLFLVEFNVLLIFLPYISVILTFALAIQYMQWDSYNLEGSMASVWGWLSTAM